MTIYSLDIFLSWFGPSLLFHVQFCYFLTCIQISQEEGKVVWYSYLSKNFPQFVVIHTVNDSSLLNEEVDSFLEFPCFFYDFLISGSSAFSKSSLSIWKFLVHIVLKFSLKDFEHYLTSVWSEHNCAVVWTIFGISLLCSWMKTDLFQSCEKWKTLKMDSVSHHWSRPHAAKISRLIQWISTYQNHTLSGKLRKKGLMLC